METRPNTQFSRTELLIGSAGLARIENARIILFGVGGVGSYTAEALVRGGIEKLTIVDKDVVDVTNINRQLIALHSTVGRVKVEVATERLRDINPEAEIVGLQSTLTNDNIDEFHLERYDYIIDAIDTVSAKIALAVRAEQLQVPIIASMGTGNKLNPAGFEITDIYKTSVCPLAKVMRKELKARGVGKLKVLFSKEPPRIKRTPPGSISFVPSVAGLMIAGEVIGDLLAKDKNNDQKASLK